MPKNNETEKPTRFFRSFFFSCPLRKSAYISVWKPRYGWTHGQLRHAAAQQRQSKGAAVGVGRLNTSTYYTAVYKCSSTTGGFIIHWCSVIDSLACWDCPLLLCPRWTVSSKAMIHGIVCFCFWAYIMLPGTHVWNVTCYVMRDAVVRDAWCAVRGGPLSSATPAELQLWPLSNLPGGRIFGWCWLYTSYILLRP